MSLSSKLRWMNVLLERKQMRVTETVDNIRYRIVKEIIDIESNE